MGILETSHTQSELMLTETEAVLVCSVHTLRLSLRCLRLSQTPPNKAWRRGVWRLKLCSATFQRHVAWKLEDEAKTSQLWWAKIVSRSQSPTPRPLITASVYQLRDCFCRLLKGFMQKASSNFCSHACQCQSCKQVSQYRLETLDMLRAKFLVRERLLGARV